MTRYALPLYLLIVALLAVPEFFLSGETAMSVVSVMIFVIGILAMIFQRVLHRGRIRDMGLRLNRNMLISMVIATVFTGGVLLVGFVLPVWLGWETLHPNPAPGAAIPPEIPPVAYIAAILIFGTLFGMLACLFGEEMAFRGYILPKLEERYGAWKAVVGCCLLFGLWHLPAYFSIYRGGAAEQGAGNLAMMLLAHGISAVPICILYLATRDLYGISFYHSVIDIIQYAIIANPEMGDASKDALYTVHVNNDFAANAMEDVILILGIPFMLLLCRLARRWLEDRPRQMPVTDAGTILETAGPNA
jgi:membrane protease YdiL (CAAX protease family)